jgi:hypothetical protein
MPLDPPPPWSASTPDLFVGRIPPERPDIYVVILDGYARDDTLRDLYSFDNSQFLGELRSRGFFIAEQSLSNYSQTSLSLASLLNMSYLDGLSRTPGSDVSQRSVARAIRHSESVRLLRQMGYRIVALATGYRRVDLETADVFLTTQTDAVSPFEALLLEGSAAWGIYRTAQAIGLPVPFPGYAAYRDRIKGNIELLSQAAAIPGPKLVFAHLLVPHPPFVFGPAGDPHNPETPFRAADGDQFPGTAEDYRAGYRNQVAFANRAALDLIDRVLAGPAGDPVILLQGDHGPGMHLDWADPLKTDFLERHAILNAYRLPVHPMEGISPRITPVNSFRLVFNTISGASYPLLEDEAFFSSWRSPFDFIPLSERVFSR